MSRSAPPIDLEARPANDALELGESLSELDGRPLTNPLIPELIDDLPDDPEADALDPIRLAALAVRGIDPSLLDEPIVDDFDGSEAVLEDDVEEIDEHEAVFDDDFEEVSGEMIVDDASVTFEDPEDEEIRSVRPLPTPPPTPPRKA